MPENEENAAIDNPAIILPTKPTGCVSTVKTQETT
jgi:hypothetical protein